LIPSAEVTIGNSSSAASEDQQPAHQAELTEFLIDAEPVSNLAFCRFLNSVNVPLEILLEWCGVVWCVRRRQTWATLPDKNWILE
jgi:formylglycine-generating enzyme required for sulfatase activity